jgi:hypothetical protein
MDFVNTVLGLLLEEEAEAPVDAIEPAPMRLGLCQVARTHYVLINGQSLPRVPT